LKFLKIKEPLLDKKSITELRRLKAKLKLSKYSFSSLIILIYEVTEENVDLFKEEYEKINFADHSVAV
jgi:hypothetical protein